MKLMTFTKPAFRVRRDPDSGWQLALWKWRLFFNVTAGPTSRDGGSLVSQLRGRAKFLREFGQVKSADLMERAASRLEEAG